MDRFKFGLEYETLVEVTNPLFKPLAKYYKMSKMLEFFIQSKTEIPKYDTPIEKMAPEWFPRNTRGFEEMIDDSRDISVLYGRFAGTRSCSVAELLFSNHMLFAGIINRMSSNKEFVRFYDGNKAICIPDILDDVTSSTLMTKMGISPSMIDTNLYESELENANRPAITTMPHHTKKRIRKQKINKTDADTMNVDGPHSQWTLNLDPSVFLSKTDSFIYENMQSYIDNKYRRVNDIHNGSFIQGIEIVSPILRYRDIAFPSRSLDEAIGNFGGNGMFKFWNSQRTSTHVHISYGDATTFRNPETLLKISLMYWYFEPILFLLSAHWRRNNQFCTSLRDGLMGVGSVSTQESGFLTSTLRTKKPFEAFYRNMFFGMTRENYVEMMTRINLKPNLASVALLFQDLENRYSAWNLLNLVPKGIGTIEVRLKQGSNDMTENRMWMLLLANMIYASMKRKAFVTEENVLFRQASWDLYDNLKSHPKWTRSTSLTLDKQTTKNLNIVLGGMRKYVPDKRVWKWWLQYLKKMHNFTY
jgi:phage pi2 protein 07